MCLMLHMKEKSCWGYTEQECEGKGENAKQKSNKQKGPLSFGSQHGNAAVAGSGKRDSNVEGENGIGSGSLRLQNYCLNKGNK